MKKIIIAAGALVAVVGIGYVAITQMLGHMDGHTDSHAAGEGMAVGLAGTAEQATRTIEITMLEKDDGSMGFEPAAMTMIKGETVRLSFSNKGKTVHEFVMDGHEAIMEHKKMMEKFPGMEHADPNTIRLEPGKSGEIIWTFANTGKFEFACLIPGHLDAGMKGDITVEEKTASN